MAISNQQLTSKYKKILLDDSNKVVYTTKKVATNIVNNELKAISNSKKLTSKSWVEVKNSTNPFPEYHDTMRRKYSLRRFGNIWYEVDIPQKQKSTITKKVTTKKVTTIKQQKQKQAIEQKVNGKKRYHAMITAGLNGMPDLRKVYNI